MIYIPLVSQNKKGPKTKQVLLLLNWRFFEERRCPKDFGTYWTTQYWLIKHPFYSAGVLRWRSKNHTNITMSTHIYVEMDDSSQKCRVDTQTCLPTNRKSWRSTPAETPRLRSVLGMSPFSKHPWWILMDIDAEVIWSLWTSRSPLAASKSSCPAAPSRLGASCGKCQVYPVLGLKCLSLERDDLDISWYIYLDISWSFLQVASEFLPSPSPIGNFDQWTWVHLQLLPLQLAPAHALVCILKAFGITFLVGVGQQKLAHLHEVLPWRIIPASMEPPASYNIYPLVNVYITMENHHFLAG